MPPAPLSPSLTRTPSFHSLSAPYPPTRSPILLAQQRRSRPSSPLINAVIPPLPLSAMDLDDDDDDDVGAFVDSDVDDGDCSAGLSIAPAPLMVISNGKSNRNRNVTNDVGPPTAPVLTTATAANQPPLGSCSNPLDGKSNLVSSNILIDQSQSQTQTGSGRPNPPPPTHPPLPQPLNTSSHNHVISQSDQPKPNPKQQISNSSSNLQINMVVTKQTASQLEWLSTLSTGFNAMEDGDKFFRKVSGDLLAR